jgi:hypothetical protein
MEVKRRDHVGDVVCARALATLLLDLHLHMLLIRNLYHLESEPEILAIYLMQD